MAERWVIVGNGPSAAEHAAEIDACDKVVRLDRFMFDGSSGRRWDVWGLAYRRKGSGYALGLNIIRAHKRGFAKLGRWERVCGRHRDLASMFDGRERGKSAPAGAELPRVEWCLGHPPTGDFGLMAHHPAYKHLEVYTHCPCVNVMPAEDEGRIVAAAQGADTSGWSVVRALMMTLRQHPAAVTVAGCDAPAEAALVGQWAETRTLCGVPFPATVPAWLR